MIMAGFHWCWTVILNVFWFGVLSLVLQIFPFPVINSTGCIGQWISQHGVRCEWNQLLAKFPWCRRLTLVSPAPLMRTWWTQAMDH